MDEAEWEAFYQAMRDDLAKRYPDLFAQPFPVGPDGSALDIARDSSLRGRGDDGV